MLVNPLFAKDDEDEKPSGHKDQGYVFHSHKGKTLQPVSQGLQPAAPHARAINTHHHYPHATAGSANEQTPEPVRSAHHIVPGHPVTHHQARPHPAQTAKSPVRTQADAAVDLIRQKVASIYDGEPAVKEELAQTVTPTTHPSKHQQFMQSLSGSGKSLAQIQNEWHAYYQGLPDTEKHEIWQEFYQANKTAVHPATAAAPQMPGATPAPKPKHAAVIRDHIPGKNYATRHGKKGLAATSGKIKKQILDKVSMSANTQAKAKQHFQSLAFGLVTGVVVLVVFLFGFFNEMFIAPFIQPSRHVSATPIILNTDSIGATDTPEVIVPKINVQIPVVYDQKSVNEADVQAGLEKGIIHYPTTAAPGQQGNAAFFGHSSNNIFNKGKYKFAFVLLHELVPGDIFYLTYGKTVYSYKVFEKRIVPPTETSVLSAVPGKAATATLITCDPPGTSTNRLVVWGEQVSPNPSGAAVAGAPAVDQSTAPTELPSEGPTMWKRFWSWAF